MIGVVLQQVAQVSSRIAPKFKSTLDYIYAGAIGTGIGIGNNPEVRQAYEYYKGKNRGMSWRDKVVRRRFKGDVYIEDGQADYQLPETLRPAVYQDRYSKYGRKYQRYNSKKSRRYHRCKPCKRRRRN